ncbi:ABC transporter substrate-binding protein [Fluviicola chungangensis]|uniref:ABC transporter substrate-binding protein n=1 Tax=Fluviicola chungangensis TaxID=2597671 RepID=A0A556N2I7_9FLAO|nr:ABC transporter substrate-binding protein [Fluviicola chungangensis]TSJ46420.1 ABC transporter substrate-binding protein [Fluviicola chungangensis]
MFKQFVLISTLAVGLIGCSDDSVNVEDLKAIGGAKYGGTFRFMSSEKIEALIPLQATTLYTQRITSQLFDPILRLDASGSKVIPSVAESFSVSADGKSYTLNIRKGIYFHPDECLDGEGRELTAEDVKFTLDMSCSGLKINEISFMLNDRVVGASEFNKATKTQFKPGGVSGIKVLDRYKVQINLVEAFAGFDKLLTYTGFGIFPKEAYDFYRDELKKHPVGTGPFMLEEFSDKGLKLKRNPNYWAKDQFGNQLPFLAAIELSYTKNKRSELIAFRERKIDLVLEIPSDEVDNILGSLQEAQEGKTVKHKVDSKQSFSVTFLGMSERNPVFKDVRVRKAINHAIDRIGLVNQTLQGEGYPVLNGFIPNTEFFPANRVKGPDFNVSKANALLAQAGYPDGKGFPAMVIYVSGNKDATNHLLAKGIAKQLKEHLGLSISVELVDFEKRNEYVKSGKASLWVSGWIADYPDGESFLSIFYGKYANLDSEFMNPFKYRNSRFDELYVRLNKEQDEKKRTDIMVECDQQIVDDAVVVPLVNDDFITMINSRVRNFKTNSLENLDFSNIFIKEPKGSE